MKLSIIILNIIGIVFAIFWMVSSKFEYEPIITTVGLIATFLGLIADYINSAAPIFASASPPSLRTGLFLACVIVLSGLLIFGAYSFKRTVITGISGNNNDNNQINIK